MNPISKKKINILFIILFSFLLVSCSGTGTKTRPSISQSDNGNTNLFFSRESGYIGGGVLAKIEVNGSEIAKLGTKEYTRYTVSDNFRIQVSGAGISGMTMGSDSISGIVNNNNYFYIIGVKQGLFSAKFTIKETTESGYKQSN